ncbi:hypothetical protein BJY04DRAFT_180442 [Aspergillus karnatakaensis]|uniref:uncharacterized protein n=1 Tax=Aspergillus karnatakaensis TaxID=1810916 RepID=UPI003CCE49E0
MRPSFNVLAGLALLSIPSVMADCKLNNAIEENEKTNDDRQELCLAEGSNIWTFALQVSEIGFPTFDGENAFAGITSRHAFILYDDVCSRVGVYSPDNEGNDCGVPYYIEEDWLSHRLTITGINFGVGDPSFAITYADNEYVTGRDGNECADVSSGLRAEQACKATFSNYIAEEGSG